jgi:FkbM family methyltransferase
MAQRKMPWTLDLIHRARPWQVGAALRVLLRYRNGEHEVGGLKLWLDPSSNMGYRLLRYGDLEGDMSAAIERLLQPGESFVDLGANEGWYSLLAARRVGPSGRVLAVEPQERLWPILLRNFALNRFGQCSLVPVAVGTESDAEIALAPRVNTGASSMAVKGGWRRALRSHQRVLVRPLDDVVLDRGIERVDVLKIDIEGYELNALRSASRLLKERRVANVLMEFHDAELAALGQDRTQVETLLRDAGFHEVSRDGGIFHYALR